MSQIAERAHAQNNQSLSLIDENLRELLVEAGALFEEFDKYSSRIRTLEGELQKINANFPFKLKVKEWESPFMPALQKHEEWVPKGIVHGYLLRECTYLSWEKNDSSNIYRLFLVIEETEKVIFDYDLGTMRRNFCSRIKYQRPLIETSIQTRLEYAGQLAGFISDFKQYLKNYRTEIELMANCAVNTNQSVAQSEVEKELFEQIQQIKLNAKKASHTKNSTDVAASTSSNDDDLPF